MISFIAASRFFGHSVILLSLVLAVSCTSEQPRKTQTISNFKNYPQKVLILANSQELLTFIANDNARQTKGLSDIANKDFKNNQAMFFPGQEDSSRRFWMPDTYFNLDIFFLDKNMKVLEIDRSVPFHPGRNEPPTITRTKSVYCRHVLELKSSSPLAKQIRLGQKLKWKD